MLKSKLIGNQWYNWSGERADVCMYPTLDPVLAQCAFQFSCGYWLQQAHDLD